MVQFVGEETKHGDPSIVHEVCTSEKCRYANLEMHPDERAKRKIPNNYENDSHMPQEEKTQCDQQR